MVLKKYVIVLLCLCCILTSFKCSALGVSAKAAVVINADTGEVIYALNENDKLPMASTTKIMTGLLLCEYGNLQKEIVVTEEMVRVEGSSMGLLPGDTISFRSLLYGLMLCSGNDAANTIAIAIDGSTEKFAERMNKRAAEIGLTSTNFVTPSGLDDENHYTTAYELAVLTSVALKNEDFATAVSTQSEVLYYGNPPYRRVVSNHNRLLKEYEGAIGVKTGFTKKSGRCLVSAAMRDGKKIIAVTLSASDDWNDHKRLLDFGFSQLHSVQISENTPYSISIINGNTHNLSLYAENTEIFVTDSSKVTYNVDLPAFLYAPIKKGERIGWVTYYSNGLLLHSVPLRATYGVSAQKEEKSKIYINLIKLLVSYL